MFCRGSILCKRMEVWNSMFFRSRGFVRVGGGSRVIGSIFCGSSGR